MASDDKTSFIDFMINVYNNGYYYGYGEVEDFCEDFYPFEDMKHINSWNGKRGLLGWLVYDKEIFDDDILQAAENTWKSYKGQPRDTDIKGTPPIKSNWSANKDYICQSEGCLQCGRKTFFQGSRKPIEQLCWYCEPV